MEVKFKRTSNDTFKSFYLLPSLGLFKYETDFCELIYKYVINFGFLFWIINIKFRKYTEAECDAWYTDVMDWGEKFEAAKQTGTPPQPSPSKEREPENTMQTIRQNYHEVASVLNKLTKREALDA